MRAARWWGRGDIRVEEIADPGSPPRGWVRLRIEACGICGTDVEEYTAGPNVVPVEPHPLTGAAAPLVLGHEAVGVVAEVGDGVDLAVGTRVAVESNMFCGDCWWCQRHDYQLCPQLACLGLMADGGLAEQMLAPAFMCVPFADHVSAESAALAEPLSVAVRAVTRGGVALGSSVAVVGAGTIGLLAVQAARIAGATSVVAVERLESRRRLALQVGADAAVAPEEAPDVARDLTRGVGVDVTIEAAGNPKAAAAAVRLVRPGGTAVLLGVFDAPVPIDMMDLLLGEKQIRASLSHVYDTDFAAAVALIERGAVQTEPLITDRIDLGVVVEQGFKALVSEPEAHLKVIVTPNGHG